MLLLFSKSPLSHAWFPVTLTRRPFLPDFGFAPHWCVMKSTVEENPIKSYVLCHLIITLQWIPTHLEYKSKTSDGLQELHDFLIPLALILWSPTSLFLTLLQDIGLSAVSRTFWACAYLRAWKLLVLLVYYVISLNAAWLALSPPLCFTQMLLSQSIVLWPFFLKHILVLFYFLHLLLFILISSI